jgi:hypothetical protein
MVAHLRIDQTSDGVSLWLDSGFITRRFITDKEKETVELSDACILIHEDRLVHLDPMLPMIEFVVNSGRSLLIIADDVAGELLATLALNKKRGNLRVAAVKAPGSGDYREELLEKIADLTGGDDWRAWRTTFKHSEKFGVGENGPDRQEEYHDHLRPPRRKLAGGAHARQSY